jgi:arsenate reductase
MRNLQGLSLMKMYGIPNCDSVKKAKKFLTEHHVDFDFHDFRKDGITIEKLESWQQKVAFKLLINKRSTSWRALDDAQKHALENDQDLNILLDNPTLIKRPVIEQGDQVTVGFNADTLSDLIKG